jgi:hypothetical protein
MKGRRSALILLVVIAVTLIVLSAFPPFSGWTWMPHPLPANMHRAGIVTAGPVAMPTAWRVLISLLAAFVGQYLTAVLVLYIAPARMRAMADGVSQSPVRLVRYLGVGILLAILAAAVGALSILAVHTFPLLFILIGLVFVAALAGVVALEFLIGRLLLNWVDWRGAGPLVMVALGCLVLFAISRLPFVGWPLLILIWLAGAGMTAATHLGCNTPWTLQPLVEELPE